MKLKPMPNVLMMDNQKLSIGIVIHRNDNWWRQNNDRRQSSIFDTIKFDMSERCSHYLRNKRKGVKHKNMEIYNHRINNFFRNLGDR